MLSNNLKYEGGFTAIFSKKPKNIVHDVIRIVHPRERREISIGILSEEPTTSILYQ